MPTTDMNNEQKMREEFSTCFFSKRKEWRKAGVELSDGDANSMWEGFKAAAAPRDELIGRLVGALASVYCDMYDTKPLDEDVYKEVEQALSEAKAKGYGE